MTARTRSAKRSNPQRMSVASLAIQIRAPCARSIACKLGSPITPLPPLPPTTLAHVRHRILASPSGFAHSAAGLRSTSPPISWPGLRHLHFNESRRRVFPQPFFPPVEMRRAQLLLSAELRHTLPAPHLFGNQSAPLRPCISVSFSLRHRATLLCDDHLPQDAVHVALTVDFGEQNPFNLSYVSGWSEGIEKRGVGEGTRWFTSVPRSSLPLV